MSKMIVMIYNTAAVLKIEIFESNFFNVSANKNFF